MTMRLLIGCVCCLAVLLATLFVPVFGVYLALFFVAWSLVPLGIVEMHFGPAIDGFARAHGLNASYLTIGTTAAPLVLIGVFCLIKAAVDRSPAMAALGTACLGYLALTVVAFFRL